MSTKPTDLPGRTGLTGDRDIPFGARYVMREKNESRVELDANEHWLPTPNMQARHDGVRILTTNIEDLGRWLEVHGGEITTSEAGDGVQVWTLRTATDVWPDGSRVPVLVSVLVPDDFPMMPEIRAAVAA